MYEVGRGGVNLVKNPYQLSDKEATDLQNWVMDLNQREGALRKRPGLVIHNTSALAGSVTGFTHVPLIEADALTETLYVPIDASTTANTNTARTSTAGVTWANSTALARPLEIDKITGVMGSTTEDLGMGRIASFAGKVYYPADAYTQYPTASSGGPPLRSYDGTTDAEVLTLPLNIDAGATTNLEAIVDMLVADGMIYIAAQTEVGDTGYNSVFQYDPLTGSLKQVGPTLSGLNLGAIVTMEWFGGRLWVGTASDAGGNAGTIASIRPPFGKFKGDTAWITEYTATSEGKIISLKSFRGLMYAGIDNSVDAATVAGRVKVRSSIGVWSNSVTVAGAGFHARYGSLMVYNDTLYAHRWLTSGSALTVWKYDGTTWSQDYDVAGNQAGARYFGQGYLAFDKLFYVVGSTGTTAGVILENNAGVWTERDTGVAYRGYIGSTRT